MALSRRSFLRRVGGGLGVAAAGAALAPLIRVRRAWGSGDFDTHRVVIVGIGGGLRNREALGMAEGATMPNLFGSVPLIGGFGDSAVGPARIAPEYAAAALELVLPPPRATPLHTEGALVTNLRYAAGAPGHLQGQACLVSGYYNNLENRADARLPVPTVFELHRRRVGTAATDAWYVSRLGGFYRALQTSAHPGFGGRYGGSFLAPPGVLSPVLPLVTSGRRGIELSGVPDLPVVPHDPAADEAVRRLTAVLDRSYPEAAADPIVTRATAEENAAVQNHLASFYADNTYQSYYPDAIGIGVRNAGGDLDPTPDALTVYHAAQILERFKPSVMAITLLDIDAAHDDFNGYLRGQLVADACVARLWDFIQSTDGLRDQTTLLVLPEHGRHLFSNGQNPDSYGRSGVDHGQGDDGDRDVFLLALGPDVAPGTILQASGVEQPGRTSGRYETIDAVMTAMGLLGHHELMSDTLTGAGARPGLMIDEVLR